MKTLALAFLFTLAPAPALAHGKSKSFAEWVLRTRTAELRISFAGHDLAAALPAIDRDEDRQLSPAELEAGRDLIGKRTIEQTVISAAEQGEPMPCRAGPAVVRGLGEPVVVEVEVQATWTCDAHLSKVRVESAQLPELEPPHVTIATFLAGRDTAQHVFSVLAPSYELDVELPSLAEELGGAALAGVRSLLIPAALLFLLGLLLFERPKNALLSFAVFLLALHGAGLLFPLPEPPPWYPLTFALAVAWVGFELMARTGAELPRRKPIIGAVFSAWFGAVLAPDVDLPNRLAFALGETAVALIVCAGAVVLSVVLSDRSAGYRRPVGIAWLAGAGALTALSFFGG